MNDDLNVCSVLKRCISKPDPGNIKYEYEYLITLSSSSFIQICFVDRH
jgi:hypothetical protein